MPDPLAALADIDNAKVERDFPLSRFTTWKVGGPARFVIEVRTGRALVQVLGACASAGLPVMTLGNGSNVLFSDSGYRGVVLRLTGEFALVETGALEIAAGGGAGLGVLVARASRAGLTGLEFAVGIPGTVGGAVMTNAGAFSGSCASLLARVETMDLLGEARVHEGFKNEYRSHLVPEDEIVTSATFVMAQAPKEEIRERADSFRKLRFRTQPLGKATAGSVFKNPAGTSAGKLIDECGLKGRSLGAARISEIHANFIINEGGATARDIKALMEVAAHEVRERFGICLKAEVKLIGFEGEENPWDSK
ncbi:MAG TPA: UDP-N-acetylmuramate dehydrogenase [Candidatus Anoxymicrobiaceae bacterium]